MLLPDSAWSTGSCLISDPERLAALERSGLVGSPPDAAFDRVTALVRRVLGVPVSLVSLVTDDRQVFKSASGLPEPWATRRETPLSHSFCKYVVAIDAPLVIEDARLDAVLCTSGAVSEMDVVSYLGVPIHDRAGHVLGSLCAISNAPRAWTAADRETMTDLVALVETEITLRAEAAERDGAMQALHESEEQFRLLAETATDVIVTMDARGRIVYVNQAVQAVLGHTAAALVGQSMTVLIPPRLRPAHEHGRARYAETGTRHIDWEGTGLPALHADGREVPVSISFGEFVRAGERFFTGIIRDVTVQKKAEVALRESAERMRLVQLATDDVVWDMDVRSGTIERSASGSPRLGWDDLSGGTSIEWWASRLHPDDAARVGASFDAFTDGDGDTWKESYRFRRADATYAFIVDCGYLVRDADGVPARAVGAMMDLSERKALEDALVEAREEAEAAVRLKSALLANMSHEIRTPLTAVLGYAEILADEAPDDLRVYAETIQRGGQRLMETLNSVLDLAQLEGSAYGMTVEPVDVLAAARCASVALLPLAEARGLAMSVSGPPTVASADRAALGRVLNNLVGNALKFTHVGGVTVAVGSEAGAAVLRVSDTGAGISADFLPSLFAEFTQESEGHERAYEGNGLGLAITQRLVAMMGGRIEVESARGVGSTFTVRLPLAAEAPAEATVSRRAPAAAV